MNVILFLGHNRFPHVFRNEIKKINDIFNGDVEIYYQYDTGTLPFEEIEYLEKCGVNLVEVNPLSDDEILKYDPQLLERDYCQIRLMGGGLRRATIWRQIVDLRRGLDYLKNCHNHSVFLLRSRPDISLDISIYQKFIFQPLTLCPVINGNNVFQNKIWVQWASCFVPFYINDICFAGKLSDLDKIISYDSNIELKEFYPTYSLPILIFIYPFANNEYIRIFLKKYSSNAFDRKLLRNSEYRQILLSYYEIILKNFNVEYHKIGWHLQWLDGGMKFRIWVRIPNLYLLKILSFILSDNLLSPFAAEKNKLIYDLSTCLKQNYPILPTNLFANKIESCFNILKRIKHYLKKLKKSLREKL